MQIERRLAPFWRGLQDVNDSWAEHQIIAAARGLPIPPADQPPPEDLIARPLSSDSPSTSTQNLNSLTLPIGGRTLSAASDKGASTTGIILASSIATAPARGSSPFKPRAKALAAALSPSSRNGSTTEIAPREINMPHDPFVNGTPLEVFLYKDASECPICFLYYPPYLNHTRCCDQAICSECFVQIKRADPHYPEGHGDNNGENANANPEEQAGLLISEPACCPYCQQPEFGVTYEPPPFRRGLTYSINSSAFGAMGTAMSSSSSLNSNLSPSSLTPPATGFVVAGSRRRTQSLSANAPNVITTDRVRPDWATKLAAQRAQIARRAAAATALHTAAFLMGNNEGRTFRVGRFSRRNTGNDADTSQSQPAPEAGDAGASTTMEPGARVSSGRVIVAGNPQRNHMEDLEELMFREALRQSLATEEERRRKAEKEEKKEAKRKEKEDKKAAKAAAKHGGSVAPYGGSGQSSASGSSLSLNLPGRGRNRGNSGASNLRMEASVANALSIGGSNTTETASPAPATAEKGKGVDRNPSQDDSTSAEALGVPSTTSAPKPIPIPHQPAGPSHLRQMSSASSVSSSILDSAPGSYQHPGHLQDPHASGLSLGGRSNASEDGGDADERDPTLTGEPIFNFNSLAEMVGVQLEGEHAGRRLSAIGRDALTGKSTNTTETAEHGGEGQQRSTTTEEGKCAEPTASEERVESVSPDVKDASLSPATLDTPKTNSTALTPPEVTITPETPNPHNDDANESKQLGYSAVEQAKQITQ
jgi:hypothetical protein